MSKRYAGIQIKRNYQEGMYEEIVFYLEAHLPHRLSLKHSSLCGDSRTYYSRKSTAGSEDAQRRHQHMPVVNVVVGALRISQNHID